MLRRRNPASTCFQTIVAALAGALTSPVFAYVDLAPTLTKIISDSKRIVLVEVVQFDRQKCTVSFKEIRALKSELATDIIHHSVASSDGGTLPLQVAQWAEPGAKAVMFSSRNTALVCVGRGWYQVRAGNDGLWKLGADRPDLPLAYYGSLSRLTDSVAQMLAGEDAVLTAVSYGADDADTSIDLALNRTNMPGLVKVSRIRANMKMPAMVAAASANPAYLLGAGPATAADVPQLIEKLHSSDSNNRSEAANDLGWLGGKALAAVAPLQGLLDDPAARVRFSAAAAMLRISPSDERSIVVLANGLKSSAPTDCRDAAQAVGLAGASATSLTSTLAALLNPVSDNSVRVAALQALATLGPAASAAAPAMVPLLKEPDFAIDAAEALGRIGPAARPVPAELVQMLSSNQPAVRWAAVRSMAQIGGVESRPAVGFIIAELPKAPEIEAYNMLVYLALLGPEAKDAAPVVRNLHVMLNPMLRPATLWAIDPERNFPWQNEATFGMPPGSGGRPDEPGDGGPPGGGRRGPGGPGGMIDGDGPNLARFIYEAYFHELGNRLAPTTEKLIKQIMDGTAGEIPAWGYHLLNCTPEVSVRSFVAQLSSDDLVLRERATVALGYMGRPAIAANDQLSAIRNKTSNERERRLIEWALREINAP